MQHIGTTLQQSEYTSEQMIFSAYMSILDTFESWKRKRRKTLIVRPECLVQRDSIVPLVRGSKPPHPPFKEVGRGVKNAKKAKEG